MCVYKYTNNNMFRGNNNRSTTTTTTSNPFVFQPKACTGPNCPRTNQPVALKPGGCGCNKNKK